MNKLKEIAVEIRSEADCITCHMDDIERISDDEDKDYVLMKLGVIRETLADLAYIVELMNTRL